MSAIDKDYNINWVDLDHETAHKLYDMHKKSESTAVQCRNYILNYLGNEIIFKQNEKTITLTPKFEEIVKSEWSKFIEDAFDVVFILGICPIEFKKSSLSDIDFIPSVLAWGSYKIQMAYIIEINSMIFRVLRPSHYFFNLEKSTSIGEKHHKSNFSGINMKSVETINGFVISKNLNASNYYHTQTQNGFDLKSLFKRNISQEWILDKNCVVINGFGLDPFIDGKIASPLVTTLDLQEMVRFHAKIMLLNQVNMLSFPIFIQNMEQPSTREMKDNLNFESVRNKKETKKKQEQIEYLQNIQRLAAEYKGMTEAFINDSPESISDNLNYTMRSTNTLSNLFGTSQIPPTSIIPLPPGFSMPSNQKKETTLGMRYFDLQDKLDYIICSAYGLPRDLLQNTGTHSQNSAAQSEFFQKTIQRWANIMKDLLTFVYNATYGPSDHENLLAFYLERKKIEENIFKKIEEEVLKDWTNDRNEYTLSERNQNKSKRTRDEISPSLSDSDHDHSSSSESEYESDVSDHEPSSSSSPKKSRKGKKTKNKKQKITLFDSEIQQKTRIENQKKIIQDLLEPLKNIDPMKPIEVSLSLNSSSAIELYTFIYQNGALLDEELFIALRRQINYTYDDETIKKLKKQKEDILKREEKLSAKSQNNNASKSSSSSKNPKSSSSSSSKNKAASSSSMDDASHSIEKSAKKMKNIIGELDQTMGSSGPGGKQKIEGRGRKKDDSLAEKQKRETNLVKSKESNVKREISSRKHQATNAEAGKKNKKKEK